MNDHELRKRLADFHPPAINETARHRALLKATLALSQPSFETPVTKSRLAWPGFNAWAMGGAVLALMLVAGALLFRVNESSVSSMASAEGGDGDLRTLAQVEELFSGHLNAVIERDGQLQVDLADQAQPGSTGQPLIVQLERDGHSVRVLSYSGRSITVELKGRRLTFEVLITGDGGIVLSGDDFAWSSAQPKLLAGYRVHASSLTVL